MRKQEKKSSYDKDFYKWTVSQANLLKEGEFEKLDIINMIEEIESLGRSEKRALESHLTILLMHLLKLKYQPEGSHNHRSWNLSIKNAKYHVKRTLQQNPSLKSKLEEIVIDAYFSARLTAAKETGLVEKTFPKECPWKTSELLK